MPRPRVSSTKTKNEPALDQAQIVQAALVLLDEVGFDGLTMRSLADKLGIKAASLYWHVRDKQELMGLLAEEICAPMREPDRTLPWRERLEALGYEYRCVLLAHRDAARVFASGSAPRDLTNCGFRKSCCGRCWTQGLAPGTRHMRGCW